MIILGLAFIQKELQDDQHMGDGSMNTCKKDNTLIILKNIFAVPDSYRNLVNTFGKADANIAIVLFLLYCVAMALSGILVNYVSANQITYIGGLTNLVFVGIVLLAIKIRKQRIETIGLRKGNIKLSLIMGITLAVVLFFL